MAEAFQPIAVSAPSDNRAMLTLRSLLDPQLLTVFRFLRRELAPCRGRVLDVGAGRAPWRELLAQADYVGLDVESAGEFAMRRIPEVVYYDGGRMTIADSSFGHALCSEVLKHVPFAAALAAEIARVLRPGGSLILTIPWSIRLHHLPHDYRRLTRQGLAMLLQGAGFRDIRIDERSRDVAVVVSKIIVMLSGLLRSRPASAALWFWPLALLLAPVGAGFLLTAHVAMQRGIGSRDDPFGYASAAVSS
jgi:SAM-dependent methyltransferase